MTTKAKKQTRRVGVAGGFINQMMGNNQTLPKVGEGMTELMYSDRHAYEVLSINGDSCMVDQYRPKRVDNNGLSESQDYDYKDLSGHPQKLTWRNKKGGCWCWETKEVRIIPKVRKEIEEKSNERWIGEQMSEVLGSEIYNEVFRIDAPEGEGTYYKGMKLVEGVTKEYTNYYPVSVIFGIKQEYRDPSF
jgi:hypothetical protein